MNTWLSLLVPRNHYCRTRHRTFSPLSRTDIRQERHYCTLVGVRCPPRLDETRLASDCDLSAAFLSWRPSGNIIVVNAIKEPVTMGKTRRDVAETDCCSVYRRTAGKLYIFYLFIIIIICLFCFSQCKSYRSGLGRQRRRTVFKNICTGRGYGARWGGRRWRSLLSTRRAPQPHHRQPVTTTHPSLYRYRGWWGRSSLSLRNRRTIARARARVCTYICVCMRASSLVCVCVCVFGVAVTSTQGLYALTQSYMHKNSLAHIQTYARARTHTVTYLRSHTPTHTHTHTHTRWTLCLPRGAYNAYSSSYGISSRSAEQPCGSVRLAVAVVAAAATVVQVESEVDFRTRARRPSVVI